MVLQCIYLFLVKGRSYDVTPPLMWGPESPAHMGAAPLFQVSGGLFTLMGRNYKSCLFGLIKNLYDELGAAESPPQLPSEGFTLIRPAVIS